MQGDPVAFAVQNHGTKTVRPNLMPRFQNFPAVFPDFQNGCVQTAGTAQIDQRAVGGWLRIANNKATADTGVGVRQQSESYFTNRFFRDGFAEHRAVKRDGAVKVCDRDVAPTNYVCHKKLFGRFQQPQAFIKFPRNFREQIRSVGIAQFGGGVNAGADGIRHQCEAFGQRLHKFGFRD